MKIDLSLIIPCYNEGRILKENVEQILEVLDLTTFGYEIIFVDDGSKDNTREVIDNIISRYPDKNITKIFHENNLGRGRAVTDGIKISRGKVVGFIDIDLSTSARYIPYFCMEVKKGGDIVTALRVYKFNWIAIPRFIISKGYGLLLRLLLRLNLKDTETGCKFFDRENILPVLDEIRDNHWFWDTEIMVRSYKKGLRVVEIPSVFIRQGLYSRVKLFRDSFRHFVNLIRFRQELKDKNML